MVFRRHRRELRGIFSQASNSSWIEAAEKGLAGRGGVQAAHLAAGIDDKAERMAGFEHQQIGRVGLAGLRQRHRLVDGVAYLAQQQFGAQQDRVVLRDGRCTG
jgi:hypothetical protein